MSRSDTGFCVKGLEGVLPPHGCQIAVHRTSGSLFPGRDATFPQRDATLSLPRRVCRTCLRSFREQQLASRRCNTRHVSCVRRRPGRHPPNAAVACPTIPFPEWWRFSSFVALCSPDTHCGSIPDCGERLTTKLIPDGPTAEAFASGDTVRAVEFIVAHPGVEHEVMIGPMHHIPTYWGDSYEIKLDAALTGGDGTTLSAQELTFAPRHGDPKWRAAYGRFTPIAEGPHRFTLQLRTPEIPAVHERIADPFKSDGQRMPGY